MLVLGDAHGADPEKREALLAAYRAAAADVALQTGDLELYELPIPTWFVAGNNEDCDVIDALRRGDATLVERGRPQLLASTATEIEGRRVAGLSGTYAPTQYDRPRCELSGARRRHFVREDVERMLALDDVDVLVTHAAPSGLLERRGRDVGCGPVTALVEELSPALCLVGHYHEHVSRVIGATRVVSLAPAWRAYYTLDPATLSLDRFATP